MRFCPRCGFALAGVAMLMDNDGVILWANAFGMNQLGYIAEDFLGHSFSEVWH